MVYMRKVFLQFIDTVKYSTYAQKNNSIVDFYPSSGYFNSSINNLIFQKKLPHGNYSVEEFEFTEERVEVNRNISFKFKFR